MSSQSFLPAGREDFNQQVAQAASEGFVGCLSSVQFNQVAPLKAALTNRGSSLVTIRGPLVQSNCGSLAESTSRTLQGRSARMTSERSAAWSPRRPSVFPSWCVWL